MRSNIIAVLNKYVFMAEGSAQYGIVKVFRTLTISCILCLTLANGYCEMLKMKPGHNTNDSVLRIPFGQNNSISYSFGAGEYDVNFSGGISIKKAKAVGGLIDTMKKISDFYKSSKMSYVSYSQAPFKSSIGDGVIYKVYRKAKTGVVMEQDFITFGDRNYFLTKVQVIHADLPMNYCSPLSTANVELKWPGNNYALRSPFDNDMWATYETKEVDSVNFISSEVSAIFNTNRLGLVVGSLEHKIWKSGIRLCSNSSHSFQLTAFGGYTDPKVTHDQRAHGIVRLADGSISSPQIMVGYFDDWRTGMETYGANNKLVEPGYIDPWKGATPVGWNSWGVLKDRIDLPSSQGVVDFFADSCKLFRTKDNKLFIDLDSYWDRMIKNGLDGDVSELKDFVDYCKSRGFEPGIYWAPFTDWGKQANRVVEGSTYTYKDAWTSVNGKPIDVDGGRAMDPTHPATRSRIAKYIDFFKSMGFKMIKIDFLGHATLEADHYYDPQIKTGMGAFRSGMEFVDSLLDNKMLVYAAISPNLATARYVHMRRIACDAFKSIGETAYTLNSVTYGWWQSHLYDYMDADHVVFKDASPGENRARLASAVVTGSLITGDDYSSSGPWRITARKLLQDKALLALVGIDGKSFMPYGVKVGNGAANVFEKRVGNKLYIGVFNYGEKPAQMVLPYRRLACKEPHNVKMIIGSTKTNVLFSKQQLKVELPGRDAMIFCLDL